MNCIDDLKEIIQLKDFSHREKHLAEWLDRHIQLIEASTAVDLFGAEGHREAAVAAKYQTIRTLVEQMTQQGEERGVIHVSEESTPKGFTLNFKIAMLRE